jgi:phosphopantothenoylcysteine decarboxylase/phosphopantothenate--cysteine ligase
VVGFAAETEKVIEGAKAKLAAKGCDIVVANDVSAETGAFGGDTNIVHLVSAGGVESWPALAKSAIAQRLAGRIANLLNGV